MDGYPKNMQTFETTGGKNINKTKKKTHKREEKKQNSSYPLRIAADRRAPQDRKP